ncbi:hypothetical protein L5515_007832 [Caenorhabditis briggsae]|uniref:Uncharacterized protein n=1 Tax=Caenorhabditis briggsae TaxID=6238 RepID=A0AAE9A7X6_CAEBR|nr:hypothetical protein L3Y34_007985 [Caenorhabditis briggsae]UMM35023.1 hypothetical protein L5515_007832 [Caenorhabditis briggsae]
MNSRLVYAVAILAVFASAQSEDEWDGTVRDQTEFCGTMAQYAPNGEIYCSQFTMCCDRQFDPNNGDRAHHNDYDDHDPSSTVRIHQRRLPSCHHPRSTRCCCLLRDVNDQERVPSSSSFPNVNILFRTPNVSTTYQFRDLSILFPPLPQCSPCFSYVV